MTTKLDTVNTQYAEVKTTLDKQDNIVHNHEIVLDEITLEDIMYSNDSHNKQQFKRHIVFSGAPNERFSIFKKTFETWLSSLGLDPTDDDDKVKCAAKLLLCLDGNAESHITTLGDAAIKSAVNNAQKLDYTKIMTALETRFASLFSEGDAFSELLNIKQKPGQSISSHVKNFVKLLSCVSLSTDENTRNKQIVSTFIHSTNPALRVELSKMEHLLNTLEDCEKCAYRLEKCLGTKLSEEEVKFADPIEEVHLVDKMGKLQTTSWKKEGTPHAIFDKKPEHTFKTEHTSAGHDKSQNYMSTNKVMVPYGQQFDSYNYNNARPFQQRYTPRPNWSRYQRPYEGQPMYRADNYQQRYFVSGPPRTQLFTRGRNF